MPTTATTPAEVGGFLRDSGFAAEHATAVEELLRRCDRMRFAPESERQAHLPAEVERLILDLEGAP
jgi:hypothetical protein